ncbi:UNVERIFIED_CONTAM: hypothetical protein PYX00_000418 [Menopon gallinae]|uniref:Uncharacterized protein n=1 Tax=Menopon gallinae TaxID=328185 RepID=A0AAW2I8X9_9NEOP
MYAAASGARLAHRHNKATIKKQLCINNLEGLQVNYKAFQKHQNAKYTDQPGIHGQRKPQRCHNYTSKPYSSDSDSVLKLSSSYCDLRGRIPKFDVEVCLSHSLSLSIYIFFCFSFLLF